MTAAAASEWLVGTELRPLTAAPLDRTTLALFAGGSGDHNPIHLDIDVARAAGRDDVFAQGMLSMALLGRLLTDHFPQHELRSFSSRFTAITPVGATPTCHGRVVAVDGGSLTLDLSVVLPEGTITLMGTAVVSLSSSLEGSAA